METIGKNKKTIDEFRIIVSESKSIAQVATKLGYKISGGIYRYLRAKFIKYNTDTSHFTGQLWSKNFNRFNNELLDRAAKNAELPWDKVFCKNSSATNRMLLKKLIISGKKEYQCDCCGISKWNGKPLRLQIDHINGDSIDNREENISIVCPNCHSQTSTYCRGLKEKKKNTRYKSVYDEWWKIFSIPPEK